MKYVLNDSKAIFAIHKIFCKQVRSFIADYIMTDSNFINHINERQNKGLDVFLMEEKLPILEKFSIRDRVYK